MVAGGDEEHPRRERDEREDQRGARDAGEDREERQQVQREERERRPDVELVVGSRPCASARPLGRPQRCLETVERRFTLLLTETDDRVLSEYVGGDYSDRRAVSSAISSDFSSSKASKRDLTVVVLLVHRGDALDELFGRGRVLVELDDRLRSSSGDLSWRRSRLAAAFACFERSRSRLFEVVRRVAICRLLIRRRERWARRRALAR